MEISSRAEEIRHTLFPDEFLVDDVRVYQKPAALVPATPGK